MTRDKINKVLCKRGWLADQSPALQQCILARANHRSYCNGELIYTIGEEPAGLHALVEGSVKLFYDTRDGTELLLKVFKPGDWFGMVALLDELPLPHHARVCGVATVLTLSVQAFNDIVREQPQYLRNFALIASDNMRYAMQRLVDLSVLSPAQRLAKLLLDLGVTGGAFTIDKSCSQLELSQSEICQLTNSSRATVNQLLQAWQQKGWIVCRYRTVSVIAPQPLITIADGR